MTDENNKDVLTGLYNHLYCDETLTYEVKRLSRSGNPLTIIMLDLDYFTAFNDTYGQPTGNECLEKIGYTIKDAVYRETDIACRLDGEKFIVILPDTDEMAAIQIAERLRFRVEDLKIPHRHSEISDYLTASLGVLTLKLNYSYDNDYILNLCEALLIKAKEDGRNACRFETKDL